MKQKILIIYKSSTGFTKRYTLLLTKRLGCAAIDFKHIMSVSLTDFDMIIFGTRAHAGSIDGLKKLRKILQRHQETVLNILFVTGAASAAEKETIDRLWKNNLTEDEISHLPHFYMPSGLCYEKMSLIDRLMMKGLSAMIKRKKNKTARDLAFEQQIADSFDISSEEYIEPLVAYILEGQKEKDIRQ